MDQNQTDLAQSIKSFKQELESQGRASATILAYTKDIEQIATFLKKDGKLTAGSITSEDIDAFKADLDGKQYTAKSISRKLNSIKAFFRFLKSQNLVSFNPGRKWQSPKIRPEASASPQQARVPRPSRRLPHRSSHLRHCRTPSPDRHAYLRARQPCCG